MAQKGVYGRQCSRDRRNGGANRAPFTEAAMAGYGAQVSMTEADRETPAAHPIRAIQIADREEHSFGSIGIGSSMCLARQLDPNERPLLDADPLFWGVPRADAQSVTRKSEAPHLEPCRSILENRRAEAGNQPAGGHEGV